MLTVYISIGNSDDKLTQFEWAEFYEATRLTLREHATRMHGAWMSLPNDPWQNACWCIEVPDDQAAELRKKLAALCPSYGQDSIAWAEAKTEFLSCAG